MMLETWKSASRELLQICCILFLYSHWSLLCIWPFQRNESSMCDFESRYSRCFLTCVTCLSWCCMVLSFEFLYSGFVNIVCFVTWTAFRQSFHKIMSMSAILTFEVLLLLTGNQTLDIFQCHFLHIVNTILRSLMYMQLVILFCSDTPK